MSLSSQPANITHTHSNNSVPSSSSNVLTPTSNAPTSTPSTFEFTKRKRWADLLIHELSEAIIFVLSNECKVLFCSRAISELLGWRDTELIDKDLVDLVNGEDKHAFRASFEQSLRSRMEMLSYVRFKCQSEYASPAKEVLFEVKGYPHYIDDELYARCFFAVAKPYPSRNTAMLNTFLELKIENERLQQRLADLRVRMPPASIAHTGQSMPSIYSTPSTSRAPVQSATLRPVGDLTATCYTAHQSSTSFDDLLTQTNHHQPRGFTDPPNVLTYGSYALTGPPAQQPTEDNYGDDAARRKKIRKMHAAEQYVCVTCGRTDSPEWRKGPQGPKTLCNACGLRWAKQVRTKQDDEQPSAGPST
ncbi:white collar 2 type of transcription factor [Suillus clintonianus]|uniref:white collar 2 type of transcription factor n=1 Tax=Suillus clintonianus TaxID=1904413 RepID=UPI001B877F96|nr:white collar 2 type of transcription factor [Suillus clintonianus]KAG2157560.1 white collar 2 type of transcription factor [Suillus clintonianus]